MRAKSRSKVISYHDLRRDEKRIIRKCEEERTEATHACIRRIKDQRQKLKREFEVTETYIAPKLTGVLQGGGKRGKIKVTSPAALTRLKKAIGSLQGVELNRMCELLPPDEFFEGCDTVRERADKVAEHMHLLRMHQYFEKRGILGYYRIEWEPRKSGRLKGQLLPHLHCLLRVKGETEADRYKEVAELQRTFIEKMHLPADAMEKALQVNLHSNGNREIHDNKMAVVYASKYATKAQEMCALKEEEAGVRRAWGRLGGIKVYEVRKVYGFDGHGLTMEEERKVWEIYWELVAQEKAKEWEEYPSGLHETDEQREQRRNKFNSFLERVREGKTYVFINDAPVRVGDYLAQAIVRVREEIPF